MKRISFFTREWWEDKFWWVNDSTPETTEWLLKWYFGLLFGGIALIVIFFELVYPYFWG